MVALACSRTAQQPESLVLVAPTLVAENLAQLDSATQQAVQQAVSRTNDALRNEAPEDAAAALADLGGRYLSFLQ